MLESLLFILSHLNDLMMFRSFPTAWNLCLLSVRCDGL